MEPGTQCPDLEDALDRSTQAYLEFDLTAARAALGEAEQAVTCQIAPRGYLGRFYALQGAVALLGDLPDAEAWLAAARATWPEAWDSRLSAEARSVWENSVRSGRATLLVDPLAEGHVVIVDGSPAAPDGSLQTGIHVVQVLDREGRIVRGARVIVEADERRILDPGEPLPSVEAPTLVPSSAPVWTVRPWVGLGVLGAVGPGLELRGETEPPVQLTLPVEVGGTVVGVVRLRVAAVVAPSLTGPVVFNPTQDPDGLRTWPAQLGGQVALTTSGRVRAGGVVEARLPSRALLSTVVGTHAGWFDLELRPGLLVYAGRPGAETTRRPEPAIGFVAAWSP